MGRFVSGMFGPSLARNIPFEFGFNADRIEIDSKTMPPPFLHSVFLARSVDRKGPPREVLIEGYASMGRRTGSIPFSGEAAPEHLSGGS